MTSLGSVVMVIFMESGSIVEYIDRQKITVFGTPEEIDAHILNCIQTLGSPKGGLSMVWGVYPPTPLESIEAAARAMDKYAKYWVSG